MSKISFKKLKLYKQKHGTLRLVKKIISRIFSFVFSYRPLYIYGIICETRTKVQAHCPLEIRNGGHEDIDLFVDFFDNWDEQSTRKYIQYHFDNGGKSFLAFSGHKLVHCCWLFYHPGFKEELAHIHLKEQEAHIASAYTSPEFRGRNIYPVILQHILKCAAKENIKRAYITSLTKNTASNRGIEKVGFSRLGKIHGFKLFGKMFNHHWYSIGDLAV